MDTFLNIIQQPFTWGLAIGLLLAFFAWKAGLTNKMRLSKDVRRLENELRDLQSHLNTQLKINSEGNKKVEAELETLRTQNENMRVSMATLQSKPGRAEVRQFQVMEIAVRQMREQAPGFAPAWEKAVRQAETEVEASETGIKKLVRKVLPGIGMSPSSQIVTTNSDDSD
ncbi:MAG: hypothetical protein ACQKBU_07030 [Verrucomicrobiales bacterium]